MNEQIIEEISKHIEELNDIDISSSPSSFYSTSTTLESLREISKIVKEPFFQELEAKDLVAFKKANVNSFKDFLSLFLV